MQFPRQSITTKLLLLFLLVGISSVLIIGSYSFYSAKKAIIRRTIDQLISVRAVKKQQVEYFFAEKQKNLENLIRNENAGRILLMSPACRKTPRFFQNLEFLKNYYIAYGFTNLYIVSEHNGITDILVADTVSPHGLTPSTVDRIKQIARETLQQDGIALSDYFFRSETDSLPFCLIGQRVLSATGTTLGIIILEIPSCEINRIMLQDNRQIGLGKSGEAYLVGKDGFMRSASRFFRGSLLRIPVRSAAVKIAMNGKTGSLVTNDYRGIKVFSAYEPLQVQGLNWVVLAEIDYEEAMVPVTGLRNDILLVSLVISLLILGFSQIITKMITQPLIRLKNAAARIGEGDFNHEVQVTSGDEIGLLAETFNTMSGQIKEEREKRILALFDGQEMERRRISRELHDGLGQKLVGTKLQIENCDDTNAFCLRKTMEETKECLHSIVEELRRISNDLMPVALDELGLETALKNLCIDVERQTGIEAEFDSDLVELVKGNTAVYLFRIAQEGIQNIIKHSNATRFSLQLIENREYLILILEDNGSGFTPALTRRGNGLSNMKERASLLGGTFSIESEPGIGTTIRIKTPRRP
ncbi:MAG: HAMP domain-containing protein [Bacteroidales bacterium]|nr:HAMP domain-containing protein [Bacteroidales bacterium]